MRISYVVHQFLPRYFTGTEQYAFAVASQMQRRGHDVEVFCLEPQFGESERLYEETREAVAGLPVVRVRFWMHLDRDFERMEYRHPFVARRFGEYLAARAPDVVHFFHLRYLGGDLLSESRFQAIPSLVHLMDFWFLCPAVILVRSDGQLCEGPPDGGLGCIDCQHPALARELRDLDLWGAVSRFPGAAGAAAGAAGAAAGAAPRRRAGALVRRAAALLDRQRFLRRCLLQADRIVAPSRFLAERFADNGFPRERIEILSYGVDIGAALPAARDGARDAARDGARDAALHVGFIGTIAPHKGTDILVDAVMQTPGDLRLSIFGRTTDFAGFAGPLQERAAADPRIEFRGPFERDRLAAVLAELDLLVAPSTWYENTPFVVLEAFAAGVPVFATALGGLTEIVADGVHGEVFPRGDSRDLAMRLGRLLAEPERLDRYRHNLPRVKTIAENAAELERICGELWRLGQSRSKIRAMRSASSGSVPHA